MYPDISMFIIVVFKLKSFLFIFNLTRVLLKIKIIKRNMEVSIRWNNCDGKNSKDGATSFYHFRVTSYTRKLN